MFHRIKITTHDRGLLWREGQLIAVLRPGVHWYLDPLLKLRLQIVSARDPWLVHKDLDVIVKSGKLGDEAIVIDLHDYERALVWIDSRFAKILEPGLYALWTIERKVRVEVIDARPLQLVHAELSAIVRSPGASAMLETMQVEPGHVAVYFRDGAWQSSLGDLRSEVEKLKTKQEQIESGIPERLKREFWQVARQRGNVAVARVDNDTCSVCRTRVRAMVAQQLKRGEIVPCEGCRRILYLERPTS